MVASRPGLCDVHGTGKGVARRHRSRFRQYLLSVSPVRFSPARFSPVRFSYGPGFIRRFQLHGYFTFFLRLDPVADMPPRDHTPPSGHLSALALRALGPRRDPSRQPGLSLLRQRLSILTFHIFSGMQERVFPRVAILPALNQPAIHSSGHLCRVLHSTPPHHNGRDSRDSVPLR